MGQIVHTKCLQFLLVRGKVFLLGKNEQSGWGNIGVFIKAVVQQREKLLTNHEFCR